MNRVQLASYIDHTALKPDCGHDDIARLCAEAELYNFVAVCVAPRWVSLAARLLNRVDVHVASVVGFPHGDTLSRVKAEETRLVLDAGAHEIDMVIPLGAARDGDWKTVEEDIRAVVKATHKHALIKVILETALLSDEQKIAACKCAQHAGADYVKTSTGFASSGATLDDVRLMREVVGDTMGVKASGGIRDLSAALAFVDAGATRLGCSASVSIVEEWEEDFNTENR